MDTGSGGAVEISPFHAGGSLKGFVVSGRWPDSTKEWAQLLIVAVRVAFQPDMSDPEIRKLVTERALGGTNTPLAKLIGGNAKRLLRL